MEKSFVKENCKPGTSECCRYLIIGRGWECAKGTSLKKLLDTRVKEGSMHAVGDNCEGVTT